MKARLILAMMWMLLLASAAWPYTYVSAQKTTNTTNGSEQLTSTTTLVRAVSFKASCTNTVDVTIGPSSINASSAKGRTLSPCETIDYSVDPSEPLLNLADYYLDSGTTAATVEYNAVLP